MNDRDAMAEELISLSGSVWLRRSEALRLVDVGYRRIDRDDTELVELVRHAIFPDYPGIGADTAGRVLRALLAKGAPPLTSYAGACPDAVTERVNLDRLEHSSREQTIALRPTFDADGYPTDEFLDSIVTFTGTPHALVDTLASAFERYGSIEWSHPEDDPNAPFTVRMVTGGWSGNESIIEALKRSAFWALWWRSSTRGGLFEFRVRPSMWNESMPAWPGTRS